MPTVPLLPDTTLEAAWADGETGVCVLVPTVGESRSVSLTVEAAGVEAGLRIEAGPGTDKGIRLLLDPTRRCVRLADGVAGGVRACPAAEQPVRLTVRLDGTRVKAHVNGEPLGVAAANTRDRLEVYLMCVGHGRAVFRDIRPEE